MKSRELKLLSVILLALAGTLSGQVSETGGQGTDWHVSFINGWFTGGTWLHTEIEGEPVELHTNDSWITGLRFSAEQEFFGLEGTLAGVFYDARLDADPALLNIPSVSDASLLLIGINGLVFPTGNELVEGRVKPYITAGPGLAVLYSDFDKADGEAMLDLNVGGGVKFLLGNEDNPELRIDWRWHYMDGKDAGLRNRIYHQELTIGIGLRF